jgi:hypothetical protein
MLLWRLLCARLIADRDQQRRDVFTVMAGLLKRRAAAFGRDTVAAELNRCQVRVVVRALDPSRCIGLAHLQVSDDLSLLVVQPTEKGSGSEQAPKASIRKSRQSTGN